MKLVCISDTHDNRLSKMNLPEGDLLIHAGDLTMMGTRYQIGKVIEDLKKIKDQYTYGIVFIAGNHDFLCERDPGSIREQLPEGIVYLNNQEININGYTIYGTPITPQFGSWAFMRAHGKAIQEEWAKIPTNIDILISHGPPYGILDTTNIGAQEEHCGCFDLLKEVQDRVRPKYHVFGHIHENNNTVATNDTTYINCSQLDDYYNLVYKPIVIEI